MKGKQSRGKEKRGGAGRRGVENGKWGGKERKYL